MGLKVKIKKKLKNFTVDVTFCCPLARLLAMVGPSGAGKTTLIRIIAGLEKPDEGHVIYNGKLWVDIEKNIFVPPQKRKVGYVFQEYALFPHLSLYKNVKFAEKDPGSAEKLMKYFGIWHLRKAKPNQVSGGERQRAALAQALARGPNVLLLDEPFSALDALTQKRLQEELMNFRDRLELPIIMVTHDLAEAVKLADKIIAVDQGKVASDWLENTLSKQGHIPETSGESRTSHTPYWSVSQCQ